VDKSTIGYWAVTGFFCLAMFGGGVADLFHLDPMRGEIMALGYPEYFLTILGVAKLAGVVALLIPGQPLIKEWAYAGFSFDLLGATASHIFSGDPVFATIKPLIVFAIMLASYHSRPESRRLPR
jgi:hypothetical protein